jgi:hypothetical protein
VYEWVDTFKRDRTSVTDSECSGRPITKRDDKKEQARAMVLKNRTVRIRDNTSALDISEGLCQDISGFHKVCALWILREWRDHKDKSVETRSQLGRYCIEGENSFNLIMAGWYTITDHKAGVGVWNGSTRNLLPPKISGLRRQP